MAQAKPSSVQFNRQAVLADLLLWYLGLDDDFTSIGSLGSTWDYTEGGTGGFVAHADGPVFYCNKLGFATGPNNGGGDVTYLANSLVIRFSHDSPPAAVADDGYIFHTGANSSGGDPAVKHLTVRVYDAGIEVKYRTNLEGTVSELRTILCTGVAGTVVANAVYTVIVNITVVSTAVFLYDADGNQLATASDATSKEGILWTGGSPWILGANAQGGPGSQYIFDGKILSAFFLAQTLAPGARASVAGDIYQHGTAQAADLEVFTHNTPMSGRVTGALASISMVAADATAEMRVQYGKTTALGSTSSAETASGVDERLVIDLTALDSDTVYSYQVECRLTGEAVWSPLAPINQFKTAATTGDAVVWADTHVANELTGEGSNPEVETRFASFLAARAASLADFYMSLGDEMFSARSPTLDNQADMDAWWALWRDFTSGVLTKRPFYLIRANHERMGGYNMEPSATKYFQRWGTIAAKRYLLNPADGEDEADTTWIGGASGAKVEGAAEGNTSPLENYYTWSHGDADFFGLDPFRLTRINAAPTDDRDQWTLGAEQLAWLVAALATSTAKWKVIMLHHVVGSSVGTAYGRCGTADILTPDHYMTDTGAGEGLHAKFVTGGVTHVIKGHDHLAAYGLVGDIYYVTCPSPSYLIGATTQADFGYEDDTFFLNDYGYLGLQWSADVFTFSLHKLTYDGSWNITADTVVAEVTSGTQPAAAISFGPVTLTSGEPGDDHTALSLSDAAVYTNFTIRNEGGTNACGFRTNPDDSYRIVPAGASRTLKDVHVESAIEITQLTGEGFPENIYGDVW